MAYALPQRSRTVTTVAAPARSAPRADAPPSARLHFRRALEIAGVLCAVLFVCTFTRIVVARAARWSGLREAAARTYADQARNDLRSVGDQASLVATPDVAAASAARRGMVLADDSTTVTIEARPPGTGR